MPEEIEQPEEPEEIDHVAIKMQLIGFVKDLLQQNMALEWEINKIKPDVVSVKSIISESQRLYDFVTSKS